MLCKIIKAIFIILLLANNSVAQNAAGSIPNNAWLSLSGKYSAGWSGLKISNEEAILELPGSAVYTFPQGSKGWYFKGRVRQHDGTIDVRKSYGIRFDIYLEQDDPLNLKLLLEKPLTEGPRLEMIKPAAAASQVQAKGWQSLTVPFSSFGHPVGFLLFLKFLKRLTIAGSYENSANVSNISLKNIRLVKANNLHLESSIQPAPAVLRLSTGESKIKMKVRSRCMSVNKEAAKNCGGNS